MSSWVMIGHTNIHLEIITLNFLDNIGADMWYYQACSEMVMPFCYDGVNDMFESKGWDLEQFAKDCKEVWTLFVLFIFFENNLMSNVRNAVCTHSETYFIVLFRLIAGKTIFKGNNTGITTIFRPRDGTSISLSS